MCFEFSSSLRQSGFSLIEILLVLAIIALLGVAAFVIFSQVRSASNASTEAKNLTTIIVGVRNLYGTRADYAGLTTDVANSAHVFPRVMNGNIYAAGQPIHHVADGAVEVLPWGIDFRKFAVIYRDVPQVLCVKLAQDYGKNVDEVYVEAVAVKEMGDIGSDPVATITECNRADVVDITFVQK